jgi:hypothetical protein
LGPWSAAARPASSESFNNLPRTKESGGVMRTARTWGTAYSHGGHLVGIDRKSENVILVAREMRSRCRPCSKPRHYRGRYRGRVIDFFYNQPKRVPISWPCWYRAWAARQIPRPCSSPSRTRGGRFYRH